MNDRAAPWSWTAVLALLAALCALAVCPEVLWFVFNVKGTAWLVVEVIVPALAFVLARRALWETTRPSRPVAGRRLASVAWVVSLIGIALPVGYIVGFFIVFVVLTAQE